ncbi:MAG TPA: proteasome subunit alpha, partial [Candidatus Nanoarchaeia archaeon]|nr:proteasome subunit alpha [Candidatus Nanoarchaeia archaeon]
EGETEIEEILHKEYKEELSIEDGLRLCIKSLNKVLDENFNVDRIDAAYIKKDEKKFAKVPKDKIDKILKEIKKK